MYTVDRKRKIVDLVRQSGFLRPQDLADSIAVSESTIRRDLIALEKEGLVTRTHGGVVASANKSGRPHFAIGSPAEPAKTAIAGAAAKLIDDGDTVLLDGGSTTLELARRLVGRSIQVITNSIPVASLFATDEKTDLVMLGGYIHTRSAVALGPFTVSMLEQLNCRRAFLSAAGINESGLFNSNLLLVETERAMMKCADRVTVVADASKFGKKSTVQLCSLDRVDEMIVDESIANPWQEKMKQNGVQLIVAQLEKTNPQKHDSITS